VEVRRIHVNCGEETLEEFKDEGMIRKHVKAYNDWTKF
jgi:hypothetical protein